MNILVDDDLSFLTGLIELATKWDKLGDHLGVPAHQLDAIDMNNSGRRDKVQTCLRDMFIWWLRNGKEKTVEKLIKAVHAVGGHGDIERKIKQKYGKWKTGIILVISLITLTAYVINVGIVDRSTPVTESDLPANVRRYCDDKKTRYLQQSILPESDWPPSLGGQYARLVLINQKRQLYSYRYEDIVGQQRDYTLGDYDKIVANKPEIELKKAFDKVVSESGNEVGPLKMLVDGAPGVGKTTLSRKVSQMWAKGEFLKEYWLVLLLHLRESAIYKAKAIDDLFYHEDSDLQRDVVKFVKERSGDGVLIIFDGFDELSSYERSEESLFLHIIEGKVLPKCATVVISRPYASKSLLNLSIHRHIEILGFNIEQIKSCIEQKVKDQVKAKELCIELKDRLDIASICQIPLNCSIMLYVYEQEGYSLPRTLTGLYDLFILHSLKRFIRRTKNNRAADRLSYLNRLPAPSKDHFNSLCNLAFKGLEEDKLVFKGDEVEEYFPDNYQELDVDLPVLDLMTSAKSYSSRGAQDTYSFLHLTIQEFLAAYWVAQNFTDAQKVHFFQQHIWNTRFRMVLLFLSGLTELKFPDAQSIFSKDLGIPYNIHACHLLYESGNTSIFKYVSENSAMSKSIMLHGSNIERLVVTYLVANSGSQWDSFELRPVDVKLVHKLFCTRESTNTSIKETSIKFNSMLTQNSGMAAGGNELNQDLMILKLLDELTQITRIFVGITVYENLYLCQTLTESLRTVFMGPHSVREKYYTIMLDFIEPRTENQSTNYKNSKTRLCETLAECIAQNSFITHVTLYSATASNVSCIFSRLSQEDSKSKLEYFQYYARQIPHLAPPVPVEFLTALSNLISTNKSLKQIDLDIPRLDALVVSEIMVLKSALISNTTLQKLTCTSLYEFKRNPDTNEMELTNFPHFTNFPLKLLISSSTDVSDTGSSSPPPAKRSCK